MSVVTGTLTKCTELAGKYKMFVITATLESADDDITLTAAAHGGITTIMGAWPVIESGLDAELNHIQVAFSGLVITVTSTEDDGSTGSSAWGQVIRLLVIGY